MIKWSISDREDKRFFDFQGKKESTDNRLSTTSGTVFLRGEKRTRKLEKRRIKNPDKDFQQSLIQTVYFFISNIFENNVAVFSIFSKK